jgi:hypothetical protein
MAKTTILKKTRQQAVAKVIGTGQANINYLDLKLPDETIDNGNIVINITGVLWTSEGASGSPITVKRTVGWPTIGEEILTLYGNDNWSLNQMLGIVDTANNNGNIHVVMPAGGGTMYMTLSKPSGFIEPNFQANSFLRGV